MDKESVVREAAKNELMCFLGVKIVEAAAERVLFGNGKCDVIIPRAQIRP